LHKRNTYSFVSLLVVLTMAFAIHTAYPIYYSFSLEKIKESQHQIIESGEHQERITNKIVPLGFFNKNYDADEKEIVIDNEYYEVVSYSIKNNEVICHLLSDKEETKLAGNHTSHLQHETDGKKTKPCVYWWPLAYNESEDFLIPIKHIFSGNTIFKNLTPILLTGFLQIQINPPEA
jgi:hypothetical protein